MKTKKLKYEPEFNFELLGISSTDDDYRLSWHLGKLTDSEFIRLDDLEISDDRIEEFQVFSVYESAEITGASSIKLVSNKANIGFLVSELKNIDFFILIFDVDDDDFINLFSSQLKSVESITGVFKLEPEKLKSKEKLLF